MKTNISSIVRKSLKSNLKIIETQAKYVLPQICSETYVKQILNKTESCINHNH